MRRRVYISGSTYYYAQVGDVVSIDTSASDVNVYLPIPHPSYENDTISIHKAHADNVNTVNPAAGQTIKGDSSLTINYLNSCPTMALVGTNWITV